MGAVWLPRNRAPRVPRELVADHNGNVWLLWVSVDDEFSPTYLNLSKSVDSGKTFVTLFRSLSYADGFLYQKLAVDPENSIYMLWDDVRFKLTRFRYGDVAQQFDAEIPPDTFQIGSYPALAVSNDFSVHCAWERSFFDSLNEYHKHILYSNSTDTGKTFPGGIRVDTSANSEVNYDVQHYPSLIVDSNGIVFISYTQELDALEREIRVVRSATVGSFGIPLVISSADTVSESTMCVDSQNGVNILWSYEGSNGGGTRHYRSSDGGGSFTKFASYPYIGFYDFRAGEHGCLYATGLSDSGIVFTNTNVILSVSENIVNPRGIALLQNYPNPFNASTNILFSVTQWEFVQIK